MQLAELDRFTSFYYQQPAPEQVPEALECHVASSYLENPGNQRIALYFYERLARRHPALVDDYTALLERASPAARPFLAELVALAEARLSSAEARNRIGGEWAARQRREMDEVVRGIVATSPPGTDAPAALCGFDFDFCWIDLFVTGATDQILRVIDVLGWPDLIRYRLNRWLADRSLAARLRWRQAKRARVALALARAGILCNRDIVRIDTREDLDRLCMMDGFSVSLEAWNERQRVLPFRLSRESMLYMKTKAQALWSTWNHASQHPIVLDLCEQLAVERTGPVRQGLLSIVAGAHLKRRDHMGAARWLRDYWAVTPVSWSHGERCPFRQKDIELGLLADLSTTTASLEVDALPDPVARAVACAERTEEAKTYAARKRGGTPDDPHGGIEWTLDFAHPDRHAVTQDVLPAGDSDEWATIGSARYAKWGDLWRATTEDESSARTSRSVSVAPT